MVISAPPSAPPLPRLRLLFVLSVGIVAWMVHLVGAAVLVPATCEHGFQRSIDLLTVACTAAAAAGIWVAVGLLREFRPHDDLRSRAVVYLAWVGVLFEVINIGLILLEGAPNLVLDPCSRV